MSARRSALSLSTEHVHLRLPNYLLWNTLASALADRREFPLNIHASAIQDALRGYPDLHEHLEALEQRGPAADHRPADRQGRGAASARALAVRRRHRGARAQGVPVHQRRRRPRPQVCDSRWWSARSPRTARSTALGMGVPVGRNPGAVGPRDRASDARREVVTKAACQEVVHRRRRAAGARATGLDSLPIPISTPGFDSAPTLTATNVITRDPETGVQNHGTYRAALKAPDRLVVRMATRVGGAGGYRHYLKHQKRGDKTMPCAIVLGCPPCVAFVAPQKLPIDVDEIGVAGGLAGAPINVVRAQHRRSAGAGRGRDRDRGLIDTEYVEPEGAVRRIARPRRARGIQHADAGDGDHASQERDRRLVHQPGHAERIERDQARRLRADVSRAPAQHARHPRREARDAARAHDGVAAHHASSRSRKACRAPKSGARSTARRRSRAIAARSASRSTRTSIPTIRTRYSGRWRSA